ncbi:SGT1 and CS domain containing protein [Colletotrichum tofieldiae]|nr:SGT1 and CS domain containing protein [Colletotrichum tofieldiae]
MTHIPGHEPWYTISLWGRIDAAGSKHTVTANKIEFSLKKLEAGKWPTLQRSPDAAPAAPKVSAPVPKPAEPSAPTAQKPAAAGIGPKNWDKLEGIEDEDERDINTFFKTLYKGATPSSSAP